MKATYILNRKPWPNMLTMETEKDRIKKQTRKKCFLQRKNQARGKAEKKKKGGR